MDRSWKLFAAAALAVLPACARTSTPAAPTGTPYMTGRVESFVHHATGSRLLVQPLTEGACGIAANVDARTRYLQRVDSARVSAGSRAAIGEGDTVQVFVQGPVARSCPAQGYASAVVRVTRP